MASPDSAGLMVIDEIQRVPDLLLAIKEQVDADPRPGRYLLSGSARVLALRGLPDTLPGRIETIELWPFSQGEIDGTADRFVDAIFDEGGGLGHGSAVTRQEYAERVVRGGFPEALARTSPRRRERFFDSYLADLVAREVSQLSEIERTAEMRALIRLLAARSGQLLVATAVGSDAGLTASTVYRYLSLLEEVFLVKRIPAWSRNVSTRAVGTPKLAFTDSGIAANLLGADARSLLRPGGRFGRRSRDSSRPPRPSARTTSAVCGTWPPGPAATSPACPTAPDSGASTPSPVRWAFEYTSPGQPDLPSGRSVAGLSSRPTRGRLSGSRCR